MSCVPVTIGDWQSRCTGALHVVVAALRLSPNATRAFAVLRAESRGLTRVFHRAAWIPRRFDRR